MNERRDVPFSTLTTLRVGGVADRLLEAMTTEELISAVTEAGTGCLVIGGGSNVVVSDGGVRETVVAVRTSGIEVDVSADAVQLTVAAGESWDALVERSVVEGWSGIEALSGIPGTVGATPIQNVGAYGQEVCDSINRVEVLDRDAREVRSLAPTECHFTYRSSLFKREPDRFVVLGVGLTLARSPDGAPVRYAELASKLGIELGRSAPLADTRDAVLALRRGKGMVLDAVDHDTWSAGSFFMNAIVPSSDAPSEAPQWPVADGLVKVPSAWLIERAGFAKGFGADLGTGRAMLSTKHTLAITNRGEASTDDVLTLARVIRDGVQERFGVTLQPEPTLVGVSL